MSRFPYLVVAFRVFLALVVVGLGAAFASRSEPAASSPDDTGVYDPFSTPTPAPVAVAPSPTPLPQQSRGSAVEYTVCTSNGSWTRPSPEQEAAYLATSAVHATFDDIASQFRAPFWRDAGNEGSFSALLELTGLWSTASGGLDVSAMVQAGCAASPASRRGLVNLWLLGYVADDVRVDNGRIVVTTVPKRGFQTVQLRFTGSENPKIMPIDFYDQRGNRIETIASNATWSVQP